MYARAHAQAPGYSHARTRKHAHTDKYVTLIAFPYQQCSRERASMLRYTYIACLVISYYEARLVSCVPIIGFHLKELSKFLWN
jgi:hypothetical protein